MLKPIEFNESININGETVLANSALRDSNSSGKWTTCWFATKTSDLYYYWTFGSCIFSGGRSKPVGVAPIDRNIPRKPSSTNSNFKK